MTSIWYKHPSFYESGMKIIHGRDFYKRFEEIAQIIGKNKSVLDLGAGAFTLARFLDKSCSYEGWDLNKTFVEYYRKKRLNVKHRNCLDFGNYPPVDCITLIDILHHVGKNRGLLIEKCLAHTKEKLIICEPYKGKESGFYWFLVWLRQTLKLERLVGDYDGINEQGHGYYIMKKNDLIDFLRSYGNCKIIRKYMNIIAIYDKK